MKKQIEPFYIHCFQLICKSDKCYWVKKQLRPFGIHFYIHRLHKISEKQQGSMPILNKSGDKVAFCIYPSNTVKPLS